jgi:hypothetical protein
MRKSFALLSCAIALSLPARADWQPMTGQRVLGVHVEEWLNTGKDAPTAADLRGRVWLLEFFATW